MNKIFLKIILLLSIAFGQNFQSVVLTTTGPTGSALSTDSTGVVGSFNVGISSVINWFDYATSFLEFNAGIPLEANGVNADIWDGNPSPPVDNGFFIPNRFEDWSFDGAADNEWHTILEYHNNAEQVHIIGGIGYRLDDPSPNLGAGYVEWTPVFQFTNVGNDTVNVKPFRYFRYTSANAIATYYSNHDAFSSFWDYDHMDGTADDFAVNIKYVGGYEYFYTFSGFPLSHYRIQSYSGVTLYDALSQGANGYDLTNQTNSVNGQSELAFQYNEITLAPHQAALYWLYPKVLIVNNTADHYPLDIDWQIQEVSTADLNTDLDFTGTDVNINFNSMTYAVNGAGITSSAAKVTVAEMTGGMIASDRDSTLTNILDHRYWEIFYDTRRTASTATMSFTFEPVIDGDFDIENLTLAYRPDHNNPWTKWDSVDINADSLTLTAYNVQVGDGQWVLAELPYMGPVWHVAVNGSDSTGNGSATEPFASLQMAVATAGAGDTILVHAGNYFIEGTIVNKNIVLKSSAGPDSTFLHGTLQFVSAENTQFTGFTVNDAFRGLVVTDSSFIGINHCYFSNIGQEAIWIRNSTAQFDHVLINGARFGITVGAHSYAEINYTTIVNCREMGIVVRDTSAANIANSIVWQVLNAIHDWTNNPPNSVTVNFSDIQGGWIGSGEYNINANPYFCNSFSNFTLAENSPCLGSGANGSNMGAFDIGCGPVYAGPVWNVSVFGSDNFGDGSYNNPFATIQHTVNYATNGDTIVILEGIYHEDVAVNNRELTIGSLFMFSPGNESEIENTVLDGDSAHRLFRIHRSHVTLVGLTMKNGYAENWGGAIVIGDNSNVTIKHSVIRNNHAGQGGGGVHSNRSRLKMEYVQIIENFAPNAGGVNAGSTENDVTAEIILDHCLFKLNTANDGVGGGAHIGWGQALVNVKQSKFIENHAEGYGGLRIDNDFSVDSCLFMYNIADYSAAGCGIANGAIGTINHSLFAHNTVNPAGEEHNAGALSVWENSIVNVEHSTFVANTAHVGGGLSAGYGGHASINSTIFYNNAPNQISLNLYQDHCGSLEINYSLIQEGQAAVHLDSSSCELTWGDANIDADPFFCVPDSNLFTLAENSPCVGNGINGTNIGAFGVGCDSVTVGIVDAVGLPQNYSLHQNFPNPFNPLTSIKFDLPDNGWVTLEIYNLLGQKMKTLIDRELNAGYHAVAWNGKNDHGLRVSAGVYLYRIKTSSGFIQVRKMALLK